MSGYTRQFWIAVPPSLEPAATAMVRQLTPDARAKTGTAFPARYSESGEEPAEYLAGEWTVSEEVAATIATLADGDFRDALVIEVDPNRGIRGEKGGDDRDAAIAGLGLRRISPSIGKE